MFAADQIKQLQIITTLPNKLLQSYKIEHKKKHVSGRRSYWFLALSAEVN